MRIYSPFGQAALLSFEPWPFRRSVRYPPQAERPTRPLDSGSMRKSACYSLALKHSSGPAQSGRFIALTNYGYAISVFVVEELAFPRRCSGESAHTAW